MISTLDEQLHSLFRWILSTSWMASVLVGLILLAKLVLNRKLEIRWHYWLWILVLLKLLIPWEPPSAISIFNVSHLVDQALSIETKELPAFHGSQLLTGQEQMELQDSSPNAGAATLPTLLTDGLQLGSKPNAHESLLIRLFALSFYVWLAGVVLLTAYTVYMKSYVKRRIAVSTGRTQLQPRLLEVFEITRRLFPVKRTVTLVPSDQMPSPALYGWLRPKLLLPTGLMESLTDEQLQHIYMHELAHVRRNDIAMNGLFHVLLILHWFNPVLWYANYRMREDQELACDAMVLTALDGNRTTEYGKTMITIMEKWSHATRLQGMAHFSGHHTQLKRRMIMIKSFAKGSYRWSVLGISTLLIIGGVALTSARNINAQSTSSTIPEQPINEARASAQANQPDVLDDIAALAREGKVKGSPYAAGKVLIDQVKKEWGAPSQENPAGQGIYATYADKNVTFGYNKGNQIFDVRSYNPELNQLKLSQVKTRLGTANHEEAYLGQTILTYEITSLFQLKFITPEPTSSLPDPTVDHISVVSVQAATNLMQGNDQPASSAADTLTQVSKSSLGLLKQMYDLAEQGKSLGTANFVVGKTLIDEVHRVWGEPDQPSAAGNPYEAYSPGMSKGTFEFAAGHGDVVYEIRVSGSALDAQRDGHPLTYNDVIKGLGQPQKTIAKDKDLEVLVYTRGSYELRVSVPSRLKEDNPQIRSISVYSPKAAAFDE